MWLNLNLNWLLIWDDCFWSFQYSSTFLTLWGSTCKIDIERYMKTRAWCTKETDRLQPTAYNPAWYRLLNHGYIWLSGNIANRLVLIELADYALWNSVSAGWPCALSLCGKPSISISLLAHILFWSKLQVSSEDKKT